MRIWWPGASGRRRSLRVRGATLLAAASTLALLGVMVNGGAGVPAAAATAGESWGAELAIDGGDDTGVQTVGGAVRLIPGAPSAVPARGVLTLAPRRMSATADTVGAALSAEVPADTSVLVEARGLRADGTWNAWSPIGPDRPARLDGPTFEVQLRLTLTGPRAGGGGPVVRGLWVATSLMRSAPHPPPVTTPPVTTPPSQRVVFTGDYDTGDFSQWENCQTIDFNAACGRNTRIGPAPNMTILGSPPAHQGRSAAQFTVRDGDVPPFGGGERAEVASEAPGAITGTGDERWYRWSMYFPADFEDPVDDGWFIVMQWHGNDTNSPPLAINIGPRGTVDIGGDGVPHPTKTLGPVRRGQWVDYTLHVLFSQDPKVGFVEGTENGVTTVPKTFRATDSGTGTYLKQGIYRDPDDRSTSVIWHDALTVSAPATAPMRTALPPAPRTARPNPPGTPQDEH